MITRRRAWTRAALALGGLLLVLSAALVLGDVKRSDGAICGSAWRVLTGDVSRGGDLTDAQRQASERACDDAASDRLRPLPYLLGASVLSLLGAAWLRVGARPAPVPGRDPGSGQVRGELLHRIEVDGEVFEVRGHEGGTDYDWVNHAHGGYGFSTSGRGLPKDEHRRAIADFLRDIDPETGYLRD